MARVTICGGISEVGGRMSLPEDGATRILVLFDSGMSPSMGSRKMLLPLLPSSDRPFGRFISKHNEGVTQPSHGVQIEVS